MVLQRMMSPSLEAGAVFDAVLSVNYCANCDSVSVIAVQEKCDEKGLGAASGRRNARCRQFGRAPFGYPPRLRSGASAKQGRLSRKAREGAHPIPSSCRQTTPELYRPLENVATRQTPPDGVEQIDSSVSAVTKVQSIFISSLIRGQRKCDCSPNSRCFFNYFFVAG
jgi:hypothetical protein